MASTQVRSSAGGAKSGPKTTKAAQRNVKEYTELFFEFTDGKDYDLATLQGSDGNSKLELDQENQTRWELSLGALLKQNCAPATDKRQYIARLPKGYRLISDAKNGDQYIVGHIGGKTRDYWYHSVAEFVPHLIWLGAPGPPDRSRCSCEPCRKMLGDTITTTTNTNATTTKGKQTKPAPTKRKQSAKAAALAASASATASGTATKKAEKPASPALAPATASAPASTTTAEAAPAVITTSAPSGTAAAKSAPTSAEPSSGAPPRSSTTLVRTAPPQPVEHHSVYRAGEMVWFATQTGVWRIGVIVSRCYEEGLDGWLIAPLGHVVLGQQNQKKSASHMRPFHAFSLPSINDELVQGRAFTEIDWPSLVQQFAGDDAHRRQVVGLEASKTAARDVNASFSTFNHLQNLTPDGQRASWGGVFLGPELIKVGDAVRVKRQVGEIDGGQDVMEVKRIFDWDDGRIVFSGDVWHWQISALDMVPPELAEGGAGRQPQGKDFLRELETYNEILRVEGGRLDWVLAETDAVRAEQDVFGRFYVTFELLPELRNKVAVEHTPEDGMTHLNVRLSPRQDESFYIGRRENRKATFGEAIDGQLELGPGIFEG